MGIKKIYKYTIPVENSFSLELPRGAKILTVQEQHGKPQIWALVDPENSTEAREFCVVGTGHPIVDDSPKETIDYIGTFQLFGGNFIGHLFEIREKKWRNE